jgi:hypothetical protein
MRKFIAVFALALLGGFLGSHIPAVHAQTPNNPLQLQVSSATHTACTLIAGSTQFCFAADGLWWSNAGAAYTQVGAAAGVTSIAVCNAAGASCGTPLTGPVQLSIPKTVAVAAPTATLN